jgi:predicted Zn-dependent protease
MGWVDALGWTEETIQDLRALAYSYIQQGVYDVALTIFNALAVLTKQTVYDLQTLGALHLQLGNGLQALEYLDAALQEDPLHLPTQLNKAKALFILGRVEQGIAQAKLVAGQSEVELANQAEALIFANK